MADPLELFQQIVDEAVRECGTGSSITAIEKAVERRLEALPPDVREAIDSVRKDVSSFAGPGFHEHGSH